jgi:hypothetical protein
MVFKIIGGVVLFLVGVTLLGWFFNATNIMTINIFGTRLANAQTHVFENTKAYNQSHIQDLANDFHEYNYDIRTNDTVGEESIKSMVRIQFADFPTDKVEDLQLQQFLILCRQ